MSDADLCQDDPAIQLFDEPARWRAAVALRLGLTDDARRAAASPGPHFPAVLRSLVDALDLGPGDRVVDVGGGLGGVASWLGGRTGATVVLVEPSAGSAEGARVLFPDLRIVRGDAAAVPLVGDRAAAVVLVGVVSLLDDLDAVLAEARRLVAPGGRVAVSDLCALHREEWRRPPNVFRSIGRLAERLAAHGLQPMHGAVGDPAAAGAWQDIGGRIAGEIDARHRFDAGYAEWARDRAHLDALVSSGGLAVGTVVARAAQTSIL